MMTVDDIWKELDHADYLLDIERTIDDANGSTDTGEWDFEEEDDDSVKVIHLQNGFVEERSFVVDTSLFMDEDERRARALSHI